MLCRNDACLVATIALGALVACHPAKPAEPASVSAPKVGQAGASGIRRTLIDHRPAADLPGWETRLYLIEYAPGAAAPPHMHPAVGVGLVLDGRFESAFGNEPVVQVQAGQGFVDQSGVPHRVFKNPSPDHELRFVVAYTIRADEQPFHALAP